MQPNDLPIVCLPEDLPDEAAASVLVAFLHDLTEAFERLYAGQLLRLEMDMRQQQHDLDLRSEDDKQPF